MIECIRFFAREARWGIDVKIQDLLSSGRILWIYVPFQALKVGSIVRSKIYF
jgi:hypothetical protein